MIPTISRKEQRTAQDMLGRGSVFNGFGAPLFMINVIVLLALQYGASDVQMGLLYAVVHLTGFAALLAPRILSGMDMTQVWSRTWWARGFISCTYLFIPFMTGLSNENKVWLVIIVNYLTCATRALGMSAYMPVIRTISGTRDLPSMMARTVGAFQIGSMASQILAYGLMRSNWMSEETTLLTLVLIGIGSNSIAAVYFGSLPRTGPLQGESLASLLEQFKNGLRNPAIRRAIWVTLLQTAVLVLIGFQVSYCKYVAGLNAGQIFLLTVLGYFASYIVAHFLRIVGGRMSSRSILFTGQVLMILCTGVWAVVNHIPGTDKYVFYIVLFPVTTLLATVGITVMNTFQSKALPEERSSSIAILFMLVGVVSSLSVIGFVKLVDGDAVMSAFPQAHPYSHLFFAAAALCVALLLTSIRSAPEEGRLLRDDLSMLLPQNLYDIFRLYRVERENSALTRRLVLEGVMLNASAMSRELVLESAVSSDPIRRYSALRMLAIRPIQEAYDIVCAEAETVDSPLRPYAITALGSLGNPQAAPLLRKIMTEENHRIVCTALKSLLRLGEDVDAQEVIAHYRAATNSTDRFELVVGLTVARRIDLLAPLVLEELTGNPGREWTEVLLQYLADLYGGREDLCELFALLREEPEMALNNLLAEWDDDLFRLLPAEKIRLHWNEENWEALDKDLRGVTSQYLLWTGAWPEAPVITSKESALGLLQLCLLACQTRTPKTDN